MSRIRPNRAVASPRRVSPRAFTLIELLVVVSIIALLISILVPSLSGARRSAKNTMTRAILKTVGEGLELFKQDNEKQYRQTNGYPSSHRAEDPATTGEQDLMGAQWLVRSLVGKDLQGFIPRRIVPLVHQDRDDKIEEQIEWYDPEIDPPIDRIAPYLSVDRVEVVDRAEDLSRGLPDRSVWLWCVENCGKRIGNHKNPPKLAPVFLDAFGFPILYYAANAYGKALCVEDQDDLYQDNKKGYYTHEDNEGFTGAGTNVNENGWLYKQGKRHPLELFGPENLINVDGKVWVHSFANYIHDHRIGAVDSGGRRDPDHTVVKPFNPDTYLLISAGADAIYGTNDDVNNFER